MIIFKVNVLTFGRVILVRSLFILIFGLAIAFVVSATENDATAQTWGTNTPPTCDNNFADMMEARASLEAMREVEIAQTLILKPDSVLEYSCFMSRIRELNDAANNMFTDNVLSGSPLFQDPPLEYDPPSSQPTDGYLPTINGVVYGAQPPGGAISSATLGNILGIMMTASLTEFVYSNFGHDFAGGTYTGALSPICNPMNFIWEFTKCQNFNDNLFLTLEQMASVDVRSVPVACNVSNRASMWTAALNASKPAPGDPGGVVAIETHSDMFDSNTCSGVKPVPTGVRVFRGGDPIVDEFPDAVCPVAGCYYDGGSNSCM